MITERRMFWIILTLLFAGLCYAVSDIIKPFIFCAALAYMLDPLVDWLERHGLSRGIGAALVCFGFLMVFVFLLLLVVPTLVSQVISLTKALPSMLDTIQEKFTLYFNEPAPWLDQILVLLGIENTTALKEDIVEKLRDQNNIYASKLFSDTSALLKTIAGRVGSISNSVSMLLLMPIILFYLLRDWDRMTGHITEILPRSKVRTIHTLGLRCNRALGGFFRGQLLVMLMLGLLYAIGLSLIDLPYGFSIGMFAGFLSFIPYVGAISGFAMSIIVAMVHFADWLPLFLVCGVFVLGQTIESVILTPKLIGDSINLHPVWIIFGLLAGGSLFGFIGLLLAIPLMAVIAVMVRFSIEQYQSSTFFEDRF